MGTGGSGVAPDAGHAFAKPIIVYFPTWNASLGSWASVMPWARMTHVNIAFAAVAGTTFTLNPPSTTTPPMPGTGQDLNLPKFVDAAHNAGVKVSISLGGAGKGSADVAAQYLPVNVDAFVNNISTYVDAHNIDGVDVDVEGGQVNANYGPFIDKLVAKLHPKGKLVTSALAQWFANSISSATIGQFDFINVMSYDHCDGPTPSECATYDSAVNELNFFKSKGASQSRLVLGVPFYCHCWGAGCLGMLKVIAYGQVAAKFPMDMDYIQTADATYSCNTATTTQRKTQLAKSYGGIMAWEITQDGGGAQSLLKVIADNM